jgi:hypothetical protein
MKKIILIVIPSLLIALLIYLIIQHINNQRSQKGALQVTSNPVSKVYLDNLYLGRTPISKTEANDMIQAGNYTLKLVPEDKSLTEYQEKIPITTGVLTVVDRKFRKGGKSEGSVISLQPIAEKNQNELEVISFPTDSEIELDSSLIGNTPFLYKNPTVSDHMITISKQGYNSKTIRIRTPKGYRLTIISYLSVGSEQITESLKEAPSPIASSSPFLSPTVSETKVLILDTPTGFLRVRESASLNSNQITTVNPGEEFVLLSEQAGWFEIKLADGSKGWVSSEYARKE